MTLRFTNTLGGKVEEFTPLEPGHVRMYSCGPTVYGPAHVGNFRAFLLRRSASPLPALVAATRSPG